MRPRCHLLGIVQLASALSACESQPVDYRNAVPPEQVPDSSTVTPSPSPTSSARTPGAPAPASMPEGVSYSGGDGSSVERAVIVNGVTTDRASTRAEYAWLRNRYPGFRRRDQALVRAAGRYYDALSFDLKSGESKTIYFDITATFGKR